MRAFVAIDMPIYIRSEIAQLQNSLTVGRSVPMQNLHLTLSFLGEQHENAVEDAHEALSSIRAAAFGLRLVGVGSFGKRLPQVIYTHVVRCPELVDLEQRITRSLRHSGLEFQKQRFRPHVTIARLPRFLPASQLAEIGDYIAENAAFRGSLFKVKRFELYRSNLTAIGAIHESLASYELSTSEDGCA